VFSRYGSGERTPQGDWNHWSDAADGSVGGTSEKYVDPKPQRFGKPLRFLAKIFIWNTRITTKKNIFQEIDDYCSYILYYKQSV